MRLGGDAIIDRQQILRASAKHHNGIQLGFESGAVVGFAQAIAPFQRAILPPWNVHEHIEGGWRVRNGKSQLRQSGMHIITAIVMIMGAAQKPVTLIIARCDQRIVAAGAGIFHKGQNRAAAIGDHLVACNWVKPLPKGAALFHAHIFAQISSVKRPEIHHLIAMGVDNLNRLAFGEAGSLATAGGNRENLGHSNSLIQKPILLQAPEI